MVSAALALPLAKVGEVGEGFFNERTSDDAALPGAAEQALLLRLGEGKHRQLTARRPCSTSNWSRSRSSPASRSPSPWPCWRTGGAGCRPPLLAATGVLYTVPSIAFFFLLLPITGLGRDTAIIALSAYTLQIIYRNTIAGLANVPAAVKDAARGMGLTDRQILWRVELPLATPEIVAGLRIATVSTVALATLAVFASGGGLGEKIYAQRQPQLRDQHHHRRRDRDPDGDRLRPDPGRHPALRDALAKGGDGVIGALLPLFLPASIGGAIEFIFEPQSSNVTGGKKVGGLEQVIELTLDPARSDPLRAGAGAASWRCRSASTSATGAPANCWRSGSATSGRAIPELALIALMAAVIGVGLLNVTIALAVLGIPPILTNAFVGIRQVDRAPVDAARGMGMTEPEILFKVEMPLAIPTLMAGIRGATIAIVATATIAPSPACSPSATSSSTATSTATTALLAGAILVALLALALEFALAGLQRLLTSRGLKLSAA